MSNKETKAQRRLRKKSAEASVDDPSVGSKEQEESKDPPRGAGVVVITLDPCTNMIRVIPDNVTLPELVSMSQEMAKFAERIMEQQKAEMIKAQVLQELRDSGHLQDDSDVPVPLADEDKPAA